MSAQTVVDIGRKLDIARRKYGVMSLRADATDTKAVEKIIDEMGKLVARFDDLVSPPPGSHYPKLAEKVAVLTLALERIANRDGAVIVPADTLRLTWLMRAPRLVLRSSGAASGQRPSLVSCCTRRSSPRN